MKTIKLGSRQGLRPSPAFHLFCVQAFPLKTSWKPLEEPLKNSSTSSASKTGAPFFEYVRNHTLSDWKALTLQERIAILGAKAR